MAITMCKFHSRFGVVRGADKVGSRNFPGLMFKPIDSFKLQKKISLIPARQFFIYNNLYI